MEFSVLLLIAVVGVVISRVLDKRRRRVLRELSSEVQDICQAAGQLERQLTQATEHIIGKSGAQEEVSDKRRRDDRSLMLISDRVIYTRSFIRTFLDMESGRFVDFSTRPEVLAVGVEIDPREFRALLKEREELQVIAEGAESLRKEEANRSRPKILKRA